MGRRKQEGDHNADGTAIYSDQLSIVTVDPVYVEVGAAVEGTTIILKTFWV